MRRAVNTEIDRMPDEERPLLPEKIRRLANDIEDTLNPALQSDVDAAMNSLAIHDAEPGGYRIFEDESAAARHPGSPSVVTGVPSTYATWYKDLTEKKDGVTPLTRRQIESRLEDMRAGRLPTRKTERTFRAVSWAIEGARRQLAHKEVQ